KGIGMKIISLLHFSPHYQKALAESFPEHELRHYRNFSEIPVLERQACEILWTYGSGLADQLAAFINLRWIHIGQSGIEEVPRREILKHGIRLSYSSGVNAIMVAEYLIAMVLNFAHRLYDYAESARSHHWNYELIQEEAYGKRVGIVGLGAIGRETALRLRALGLKIYGFGRQARSDFEDLDHYAPSSDIGDYLPELDYVILSLPANPSTQNFFSTKEFELLQPHACLILASRASVLNFEALEKALRGGRLRAAAIDVFETEPLPEDSQLWDCPNLVITPHIAGARFREYNQRLHQLVSANLRAFLKQQALQNELLH
ncbi:MAG: D-2-hydroxyacid dehydrogenase, partial [Eubacteriales bacterium]|nr:D-2-hydroxyacid dehydrogenase [Eubacteriales bacterium]